MEKELRELMKRIKREAKKREVEILPPDLTGGAYNPVSKTIYGSHPVVLAHELGHAMQHEEKPISMWLRPLVMAGSTIPYVVLTRVPKRFLPVLLASAGGYAVARYLNHLITKSEQDASDRAIKLAPRRLKPFMKEIAEKAVGTYKTIEANWPFIGTATGILGTMLIAKLLKRPYPKTLGYLIPIIGATAGQIYTLWRQSQLLEELEDQLFRRLKGNRF